MAWVRIDENFSQHPKVVRAGPLGMAMHVAALCYCNRHLTDGFVPKQIAKTLLDLDGLAMRCWDGDMVGGGQDAEWHLIVEDLVTAGLWHPIDGGWQIHDYLEYQPSKAHVKAVSEARREAGAIGGKARHSQWLTANVKQIAKQNPGKPEAKAVAKFKPDTDSEEKKDSPPPATTTSSSTQAPPQGGNGHDKPKSADRGTRLKEDWTPSEAAIAHCREDLGCSADVLNREFAAFMDWGLSATGPVSRKRNWDRAFVNWIRRVMNGVREQEARERRWAEQRARH